MSWGQIRKTWISKAKETNDELICALCSHTIFVGRYVFPHPDSLEIDHIIPRSLGGRDQLENTQPTHRECNGKKSDKPEFTGTLKTSRRW